MTPRACIFCNVSVVSAKVSASRGLRRPKACYVLQGSAEVGPRSVRDMSVLCKSFSPKPPTSKRLATPPPYQSTSICALNNCLNIVKLIPNLKVGVLQVYFDNNQDSPGPCTIKVAGFLLEPQLGEALANNSLTFWGGCSPTMKDAYLPPLAFISSHFFLVWGLKTMPG